MKITGFNQSPNQWSLTAPWQMQIECRVHFSPLRKSAAGVKTSSALHFPNRMYRERVSAPAALTPGIWPAALACSLQSLSAGRKWRCILKRPKRRRQPPMVLPRVAGDDSSFKRVAPASPFDFSRPVCVLIMCMRDVRRASPMCLWYIARVKRRFCLDEKHQHQSTS